MNRFLSIALVGLMGWALIGCEASARVDTDDDDDTVRRRTTITREAPRGEATYERRIETRTRTD